MYFLSVKGCSLSRCRFYRGVPQGTVLGSCMAPIWKPLKIQRSLCRCAHVPLHADWPILLHCSFFVVVVWKVRSHLAALKSSGSVASSNASIAAPPHASHSQSFSEPLTPSFENLHLRSSQDPHHHPTSSSPSSSAPARIDPQTHPQPRPSLHELAPSEEVAPRVRTGRKSPDTWHKFLFQAGWWSWFHSFNSFPPSHCSYSN